MKLYHYSVKPHDQLLTLAQQRKIDDDEKQLAIQQKEERGSVGLYFDHVSFFLEPYPVEIAGRVYGDDHDFWFPGNVIYEHVIETSKIKAFDYQIVEFPERTALYEKYLAGSISGDLYDKKCADLIVSNCLHGKKSGFDVAASKYVGCLYESVSHVKNVKTFGRFKHKYAALVVHCMLYLHKPIDVEKTSRLVVSKHSPIEKW